MSGLLITFEGIECSGKGKQATKLLAFLKAINREAIILREPGGTVYGEILRTVIKHPQLATKAINEVFNGHEDFPQPIDIANGFARSPYCELFMFLANRAEFIDKRVKPALASGQIVITDRLHYSTRAYQGGGRFHSEPEMIKTINHLNAIALQGILPDLVILLDISIEEMIKRRTQESDKDAFFEKTCDQDFFNRTRNEYLKIAEEEASRFRIIDGTRSILDIHHTIISSVAKIVNQT
ncbi:dTMP kinase [Candidatus Falkowbacteria bacterium]|uniref:Thymidylate kinase n=1 Tax=Candidatus Buchananbacteria bacterium CG10_big_fil_rev_8_21_14_0_10_33_19 TaxID=1974525 RepID=A0A2H0W357_9BACT|nr:dTMP kinase [Candidatus Falkowbacteria bacterium]PIS05802.1 MAG: dTMP kinase [Candidatus Buchananbacteria bacterium CG10_big_fil_rev_8_21_14_0_10_33_19]